MSVTLQVSSTKVFEAGSLAGLELTKQAEG